MNRPRGFHLEGLVLTLPVSTAEHRAQPLVGVVFSCGPSVEVGVRWNVGNQEKMAFLLSFGLWQTEGVGWLVHGVRAGPE